MAERKSEKTTGLDDQSFEGVAKVAMLSVLEEFRDLLAIYRHSLEKLSSRSVPIDDGDRVSDDARMKCYDVKNNDGTFDIINQTIIFEKLQQDSERLGDVVDEAIRSLEIDGNFDVLVNEIADKMVIRAEEEKLLRKAFEMRETLTRTRQETAAKLRSNDDEEKHLRANLLKLRNEEKRLRVKASAETAYVRALLHSRFEQDNIRAEISHDRFQKHLLRCRRREENERLVSKNLKAYMRDSITKFESDTLVWLERQQIDTRSYDKEIRQLQEQVEKRRNALEELQQEYKCKQEFIDGVMAEKEAERLRCEHEEFLRRRAIKIQSWWRGMMVRKKLGPYRPEERKRKNRTAKSKKVENSSVSSCKTSDRHPPSSGTSQSGWGWWGVKAPNTATKNGPATFLPSFLSTNEKLGVQIAVAGEIIKEKESRG